MTADSALKGLRWTAGALLREVGAQQIVVSAGQIERADNCTAVIVKYVEL